MSAEAARVPACTVAELPAYRWVILGSVFLINMIFYGISFSYGVFLKPLIAEFGWSRGATAFGFTVTQVVSGIFSFAMGLLSDRLGFRAVVTGGGVLFSAGIVLAGSATSLWNYYLFIGLMAGLGRACFNAPMVSAIAQWFDRSRGRAFGIALSGMGFGTLILPPLANALITTVDWRYAFQVVGMLALLLIVGAGLFLRNRRARAAAEVGGPEDWKTGEALGTRTFWHVWLTNFCCCFSHSFPLVHMAAYATDLGAAPATGALMLAVTGALGAVGRVFWGLVGDRLGPRRALILVLSIQTAVIFSMTWVWQSWMLFVLAAALGLSFGGVYPLYALSIHTYFGTRSLGGIYGYFSAAAMFGMGFGGYLGGQIFDWTGSYLVAFLASTGLGIGAITFAVLTRQPSRARPAPVEPRPAPAMVIP